MPQPTLRLLIAAVGAALFAVPACDEDPASSDFTDDGGSAGSARGGSSSAKGGSSSGGESTSGGSAGETSDGGASGGESGAGAAPGGGGADETGGSSSAQGGGGGEPATPGSGGTPGAGWYCNVSATSCVCVQVENEVGDCGLFDCCYTYDGGPAGLACACSDAAGAACDAEVQNEDGTRVDFCPP